MVGYVLNALSPEEAAEFERYLQADPSLTTKMKQLEEVIGLIGRTPPLVAAPAELKNRIIKAAQAQVGIFERLRLTLPAIKLPAIKWRRIAAIALALVAVGVAIDNYQLRQKLALQKMSGSKVEESELYVFHLKGTPAASTSMGSVMLDLHAGRVVFALQNLPPLPEGEAYHLWAFMEGKKILCGRFNTTPSGQIVTTLPVELKEYTNPVKFVRVSRESTTTPPNPQKKALVMTSES